MDLLDSIRNEVYAARKERHLRQSDLAQMAQVSLPTLKALEQGKAQELGFHKIVRILAALGLELRIHPATMGRPTLDQLREESNEDGRGEP